MYIRKLLHKIFKDTSEFIGKRNHNTLIEAVVTLSVCKHLSSAALGRHLESKALIKNNIKRIDRYSDGILSAEFELGRCCTKTGCQHDQKIRLLQLI